MCFQEDQMKFLWFILNIREINLVHSLGSVLNNLMSSKKHYMRKKILRYHHLPSGDETWWVVGE